MNDGYQAPDIDAIRQEANEVEVDDRIQKWIDNLPEPFKGFVLALIEQEETGEMPLPPMGMPPIGPAAPPMPAFVPPTL